MQLLWFTCSQGRKEGDLMKHIQLTMSGNWTTRIDTILSNNEIDKDMITFMAVSYSAFLNETSVKIYCRDN